MVLGSEGDKLHIFFPVTFGHFNVSPGIALRTLRHASASGSNGHEEHPDCIPPDVTGILRTQEQWRGAGNAASDTTSASANKEGASAKGEWGVALTVVSVYMFLEMAAVSGPIFGMKIVCIFCRGICSRRHTQFSF